MEEDGKNYPSLPSNYVTLVQLQERWLKDQQRKQAEKAEEEKRKEEEERKRREREFEERKREERENGRKRNKITEGSKAKNNLYRPWPFEKNRPMRTEKSFGAIGVSEQKSEESQVGAIVAGNGERKIDGLNKKAKSNQKKKGEPMADDDLTGRTERSSPEYAAIVAGNGERKIDGLKKKKKKSNRKKKGKPTAEDDLTGRTERSLPEHAEVEKKIPVVLTEREGEIEGVTSDFPRNGKNSVVEGMIPEKKKVPEDRSTEMGGKIKNLSLSGGKGRNERHAWNMRGGQETNNWKKKGKPTADDDLTGRTERSLPEYAAIVAGNGERKIDGKKKKKKKSNQKKMGKPTAEDDLTGRAERSFPEYAELEKKIPVVLTEGDGEIEGVTSDFPRNGKNLIVEGMIPEKKKVPEDRSTEMGGKFKNLSLSGGKGRNERHAWNMRGGQERNNQSSELFDPRSPWKPRDSKFVWVRKWDTSAVNAAEVCNSGVLGKARGNWYQ